MADRSAPSARRSFIYTPGDPRPFKLSRNRLEHFLQCKRCFYLTARGGVKRPDGYPFTLNLAVDFLLKKEFDLYRARQVPHPDMIKYGIHGVPFWHTDLDRWRENFKGLEVLHKPTNFLVTGAVDDIWLIDNCALAVADYKATSSKTDHSIESSYWVVYKRQIEIYQWLLAQQNTGYPVSATSYFVLVNGQKNEPTFNNELKFNMEITPYRGATDWVGQALMDAKDCLESATIPNAHPSCDYCAYYEKRFSFEKNSSG